MQLAARSMFLNIYRADALFNHLWRHCSANGLTIQEDGYENPLAAKFPAQWFEQPLDHFDNKSSHRFLQRYWVNDRHYEAGGPVFVLDGGETSGEDRLPFLDTGIVDILAQATMGLGIVLEHRLGQFPDQYARREGAILDSGRRRKVVRRGGGGRTHFFQS